MIKELDEFSMNYFSLNGKVAVVTGGNKGIGQACAVALAKAGADLVIPTHGKDWNSTRELIEREGRQVTFIQGDLTNKEDRENVVKIAMQVYGRIDILVNNAGMIKRAPLLEYKEEDWNSVMDINLNSLYFLSQDVARIMDKQGSGKIINIASMLSFQGGKFVPPYTASKHAVAGLTKSFANELASRNIQVNAIAPGYVSTDNTKQIREDEKRNNEILDRIPANRWAQPSDLMGTVVFLASRASDYVNGHILPVDGGWLVR